MDHEVGSSGKRLSATAIVLLFLVSGFVMVNIGTPEAEAHEITFAHEMNYANNVPKAITAANPPLIPSTTTDITITVPETYTVTYANVETRITHTNVPLLVVDVIHGGKTWNIKPILAGSNPWTRTYADGATLTFNGDVSNSNQWIIRVTNYANIAGTINYFRLRLTYDHKVHMTSPAQFAEVKGVWQVNATSSPSPQQLDFYVDGGWVQTMTWNSARSQYETTPYDTTALTEGNHQFEVWSYDMNWNLLKDTHTVNINNYNIYITRTSPTTGATYSGNLLYRAWVPSYTQKCEYYFDDSLVGMSTPTGAGDPKICSYTLDTRVYVDGRHTIKIMAYDPNDDFAVDQTFIYVKNWNIFITITARNPNINPMTVDCSIPSYTAYSEAYFDGVLVQKVTNTGGTSVHFDIDLTYVEDGSHILKVMAYDPAGASASDSEPVVTNVHNPLVINWVFPVDGSTVADNPTPQTVVVSSSNVATKAKVYVDGVLAASSNTRDINNWFWMTITTKNYADGNHAIMYEVTDRWGNMVSMGVTYNFENYAVSVSIDPLADPLSGTVTVSATIADSQRAELWLDGTFIEQKNVLLTDTSVSFSLDTTQYNDGSHVIKVKVYGPGDENAEDSVTIDFENYAITTFATNLVNGATLSGTSYNVLVLTDDFVLETEIAVDGQVVATNNFPTNPIPNLKLFTIPINTQQFPDGSHTVTIILKGPFGEVYRANYGVTFNNYNLALALTATPDGGTITVTATVSNLQPGGPSTNLGEHAMLYIDNTFVNEGYYNPGRNTIVFTFDSRTYKDGTHTVKVVVENAKAESAQASRTIAINNWDLSVSFIGLSNPIQQVGTSTTITVRVTNLAPNGPSSGYSTLCELYLDGDLVAFSMTISGNQYTFSMNLSRYYDGPHTFMAKAYDPDGRVYSNLVMTNFNNWNTQVIITNPLTDSVLKGTIALTYWLSSTEVTYVYVDNTVVFTDNAQAPRWGWSQRTYQLNTSKFVDGKHVIKVETYTLTGNEKATAYVSVMFDNTPPEVTDGKVIYKNGLKACRASGDKVVIVARVVDEASGLQDLWVNASNIGGGTRVALYDDGNHDDEFPGDGIYGTDAIDVVAKMGRHRVFINTLDKASNTVMGAVIVQVDDHLPVATNVKVLYPIGQSAAKFGDAVRVRATASDTHMTLDVVLVIDTSGSMMNSIDDAKDAAKSFVDQLGSGDRVAVYSFDGPGQAAPKLEIGFTTDKTAIKNEIDTLGAWDWTPLYDTMYTAMEYAKTSNNLPVLIALTDGIDCLGTDGWGNCNKFSTHTKEDVMYATIPIFTIGLEPRPGDPPIDTVGLTQIAQTSNGGSYYYSATSSDLAAIYDAIAQEVSEMDVGGITRVILDLTSLGGSSNVAMFDDGVHDDLFPADGIYGSEIFSIPTLQTQRFRVYVNVTDTAGNMATGWGFADIDNTYPVINYLNVNYPPGNWWASKGDAISFEANITDPGDVGGISTVTLDATNIGAGFVILRDDGTNGDTTAGDSVYTSPDVTVTTSVAASIEDVHLTVKDIAYNVNQTIGQVYIDNNRPLLVDFVAPLNDGYIEGRSIFQVSSNNVDGVRDLNVTINDGDPIPMRYNPTSRYFEMTLDTTQYTDGNYTAEVDIIDIAAQFNPGPSIIFHIDNTPPTLIVVSPKDGAYVQGSVYFDTTGTSDIFLDTIKFQVDNFGPWTNTTLVFDTTKYTDGLHKVTVMARDKIGHETTKTLNLFVDNDMPTARFIAPAPDSFVYGKLRFKVEAKDNVSVVSVAIRGAVNGTMAYNDFEDIYYKDYNTTDDPDGTYVVYAEVKDPINHTYQTNTLTYYIDNNAPNVTVLSPLDGSYVEGNNVSVKMSVFDGPFKPAVVAIYIDGVDVGNLTNLSYSWNTTKSQDGKHTIRYHAQDNVGRIAEKNITVTVDNNAPTLALISPADGAFLEGMALFQVKATDAVGLGSLRIDIVGIGSFNMDVNESVGDLYSLTVDTTAYDDARYAYNATAKDKAGHTAKTLMRTVYVDNHAPELTVTSPKQNQWVNDWNATVSAWANETFLEKIEYHIDNGVWVPLNQTFDTKEMADGRHTLDVRAIDMAGHTDNASLEFRVDNNPPTVELLSPEEGQTVTGVIMARAHANDVNGIANFTGRIGNKTMTFFYNEATGYYEYSLDTRTLPEGDVSLNLDVRDTVGQSKNLSRRIKVDNAGPGISVLSPDDGKQKGKVGFTVAAQDPSGIGTVFIRIDGGDWRDMRALGGNFVYTWKTSIGDDGDHLYEIKAVDNFGNGAMYNGTVNIKNKEPGFLGIDMDAATWNMLLWLLVFILFGVCIGLVAYNNHVVRKTRDQILEYERYRPAGGAYYSAQGETAAEGDYDDGQYNDDGYGNDDGGGDMEGDDYDGGAPQQNYRAFKPMTNVVVTRPTDGDLEPVEEAPIEEVEFMDDGTDTGMDGGEGGAEWADGGGFEGAGAGGEEVEFMDDGAEAGVGAAVAGGAVFGQVEDIGDESAEFIPEDGADDVEFTDDGSDTDVGGDEVEFTDGGDDFAEDLGGDEVEFSDDADTGVTDFGEDEVEFSDGAAEEEEAALPPPPPKPRIRLQERKKPAPPPPRPARATTRAAPKGRGGSSPLDDVLGPSETGRGKEVKGGKRDKGLTTKRAQPKEESSPLNDLIGDI